MKAPCKVTKALTEAVTIPIFCADCSALSSFLPVGVHVRAFEVRVFPFSLLSHACSRSQQEEVSCQLGEVKV